MKFKKLDLRELADREEPDGFKLISRELTDTSRWSLIYTMVFSYGGKLYSSNFRRGATENQYEYPYEYDDDEVECPEVIPVQKTITVYELAA